MSSDTRRIAAVVVAIALAGCGYDITPQTAKAAEELCAAHGGLKGAYVERGPVSISVSSDCHDGERLRRTFKEQSHAG